MESFKFAFDNRACDNKAYVVSSLEEFMEQNDILSKEDFEKKLNELKVELNNTTNEDDRIDIIDQMDNLHCLDLVESRDAYIDYDNSPIVVYYEEKRNEKFPEDDDLVEIIPHPEYNIYKVLVKCYSTIIEKLDDRPIKYYIAIKA